MLIVTKSKVNKLTKKQNELVDAIITTLSNADAMKKANVPSTTFYRWMQDPLFKGELQRKREAATTQTLANFDMLGSLTVETAMDIMKNSRNDMARAAIIRDVTALITRNVDATQISKGRDLDNQGRELDNKRKEFLLEQLITPGAAVEDKLSGYFVALQDAFKTPVEEIPVVPESESTSDGTIAIKENGKK